MKRILSILLCAAMRAGALLSFSSCAKEEAPEKMAYVLAEKGNTYSLGLANNFKKAFEEQGGGVTMEMLQELG